VTTVVAAGRHAIFRRPSRARESISCVVGQTWIFKRLFAAKHRTEVGKLPVISC
jgi:hypothetical protein